MLPSRIKVQARRSTPGLNEPDINIGELLYNVNSAFNPLHKDCLVDYHVEAISHCQVSLTVVLPNEMLNCFAQLLESMGGLFRVMNGKARSSSAELRVYDLEEVNSKHDAVYGFRREVCSLYDEFMSKGLGKTESIKQTNMTLKAAGSPWASLFLVEKVLREEGKLKSRKNKRAG